ncbi:helix-turn-helix domain-containing protein [Patulibacter medicamentivorans]|uniref:helix-turn-helix domain-containing protein n=1 Tax=Patulibacter medicamentivorans TaxID=1097667 RepID=UPI000590091E|nr:helix-turn-helix domain-containing protein [Patulibacter medicamentivorans]
MLTDTVTVAQAAEMTGKHPQTIRRWAKDGTLECTRLGHREFRIFKASLSEFIDGASAGTSAAPASGQRAERPGGGLFDPEWGLFTRQPFHDPENAS